MRQIISRALEAILQTITRYALFLALIGAAAYFFRIRYRKGLRDIPGPFWASILSFDRVITTASGKQQHKHLQYHNTYGPFVRVGPNHVSISRGEFITQIYGIGNAYPKSEFYSVFDAITPHGVRFPTLFSIRDEKAHKSLKRPVASAFSMTSLVELEPLTDICIEILISKLNRKQGQSVDFGTWLHWYAFDVITSLTFSTRQGFMETETDVDGIINAIEGRLVYNSIIGQVPFLHKFLLGNNFIAACAQAVPLVAKLNTVRSIVKFAASQLEKRTMGKSLSSNDQNHDLLDRFRRVRDSEEVMTNGDLLNHAASNVFAGSDTTAISLRSMFYYLCKNKRCYEKLREEIDNMDKEGSLSSPITFGEASRMPYLQACMKEAMRLHPAVGQMLERVVPEEGAQFGQHWLPPGTIVGINPWVVSREKAVYGEDVDDFRPERWLDATPEAAKYMQRNFLAFGSGGRSCLGKNISLLEMSKLVPELLRRFDIELSSPMTDWTLNTFWFVKQTDLFCNIKKRPTMEQS